MQHYSMLQNNKIKEINLTKAVRVDFISCATDIPVCAFWYIMFSWAQGLHAACGTHTVLCTAWSIKGGCVRLIPSLNLHLTSIRHESETFRWAELLLKTNGRFWSPCVCVKQPHLVPNVPSVTTVDPHAQMHSNDMMTPQTYIRLIINANTSNN